MKPKHFSEANVTFAKNQPEYLPLPAYVQCSTEHSSGVLLVDNRGWTVTCWKANLLDRFKILLCGRVWVEVLTFGGHLQPQKLSTTKPIFMDTEEIEQEYPCKT